MANSTEANESLSNPIGLFDSERGRPYNSVEMVFIVIVTVALSLVTIVGNILVIVSIKVNKHLQTINNYFLLSLACADLIIGVFSMNLYTTYIVIGAWPLGPVVCDLWLALDYVVSNVSSTNLLIISFDRYFCVTKPLSYPVMRTTKIAGRMIAGIWLVPFIIWAPAILFWQFIVGERTVSEGECYVQFLSNPAITFGTAVATFYLYVFIMIILSVQISRASKSRMKENRKESESNKGTISPSLVTGNLTGQNTHKFSDAPAVLTQVKLQAGKITGRIIVDNHGQAEENRLFSGSNFPSVGPSIPFSMDNPKLNCVNTASKFGKYDHCVTTAKIAPDASSKIGNDRESKVDNKISTMITTAADKRKGAASREKKVTRTVLAILLAFIITLSPYFVMVLIYTVCSSCVPYTVWTIGYWLCYINSTVNPACYALCNPTFKKTFKRLLMCQYKNIGTTR
ncbi:muscarinic acetylcholine receptor M2-like [Scyliorhinus canicula]|uniref:muscarinic acetylcholine receptor M2-like n=1 Tax=Scyliorhinus canicula TaxID=7830 RepID=UPI0018F6C879|nr:muscarinic acetylcholine receptor M2-like [Scyliorhinus canicula]